MASSSESKSKSCDKTSGIEKVSWRDVGLVRAPSPKDASSGNICLCMPVPEKPEEYKLKVKLPGVAGGPNTVATMTVPANSRSICFWWDDSIFKLNMTEIPVAQMEAAGKPASTAAASPVPAPGAEEPALVPGCSSSSSASVVPLPPSDAEPPAPAVVSAPFPDPVSPTRSPSAPATPALLEPSAANFNASGFVLASDVPAAASTEDGSIRMDVCEDDGPQEHALAEEHTLAEEDGLPDGEDGMPEEDGMLDEEDLPCGHHLPEEEDSWYGQPTSPAASPPSRADEPALAPDCSPSPSPVTPFCEDEPPSHAVFWEDPPVSVKFSPHSPPALTAPDPPEPSAAPSGASGSDLPSDAPVGAGDSRKGDEADPICIDDLPDDEHDPAFAAAVGAPAIPPPAAPQPAPAPQAAPRKPKRGKKPRVAVGVPRPGDAGPSEPRGGAADRAPASDGAFPYPPSPRAFAALSLQQSKVVIAATNALKANIALAHAGTFGSSRDKVKPGIEDALRQGARVWGLSDREESAMHLAARRNTPELVRLLYKQGSDCRPPPVASMQFVDQLGYTPLIILAWETGDHPVGNSFPLPYDPQAVLEIGRIMIGHSADPVHEVNCPDKHGWTPVMTVAENSAIELLKLMMPHADLAHTDKQGYTALHWAAQSVRPAAVATVRLLLQSGADPHARNKSGDTPAALARFKLKGASGEAETVVRQVLSLLECDPPKAVTLTPADARPAPAKPPAAGAGTALAGKRRLSAPDASAKRKAPDSRRSSSSSEHDLEARLSGVAECELVAAASPTEWQDRLLRVIKKKLDLHAMAAHLCAGSSPGLLTLAQQGLLHSKSVLMLLASPPKQLSMAGCLFREPLSMLLRHILPQGAAADPSTRRLLRHCGQPSCDAQAAEAVFSAETGLQRERQEARLEFLLWLGGCSCSAVARALVRVKTSPPGTECEVADGAFERAHLLYHLSGPAPVVAGAPGSAAAMAPTAEVAVAAAHVAAPEVKRKLDEAGWPTRVRQLMGLWWARAVGPGWDSQAQMRLASSVFESRPFLHQLNTVLLHADPNVTIDTRIAPHDGLPPFVYTAEYLSYDAFPTLPVPLAAGCKCARPEDGATCCRVAHTRYDCSCSSRAGQSCGFACSCAAAPNKCVNRRWPRGAAKKLVLARANQHGGWGVQAGEPIKKEEFVCEYLGEYITLSEDHRRASLLPTGGDYIFQGTGSVGATGSKENVHIDAFCVRNIAAFINFRCDPNLYAKPIRVTGDDPRWSRIGLFAKTDIRHLEELGYLRDPGATSKSKYSEMQCRCGAESRGGKCRGYL